MNLRDFDIILLNTSGGKDSQAMLGYVAALARAQGVLDRCVAVHADLGRVEWAGTRELAEEQARDFGLRFEIAATRPQGDLLMQVEYERGKWMSPTIRFCTSDHKTAQVKKVLTGLVDELRAELGRRVRVLNCLGLRAQESDKRRSEPVVVEEQGNGWSNGRREVTRWLPIHEWSEQAVWFAIHASGVRYHRAYDLGMPRLSCCFCIYANRDALLIAGEHNPELLAEYVRVERKIGHTFKAKGWTIESIQAALAAGERGDKHSASFGGAL